MRRFAKNIFPRCNIFVCIAGFFWGSHALAQTNERSVGIGITDRFYMSNYEYFNPIVPGYTLFGNVIEPILTFKQDRHWTLTTGAWLQQDFGHSGFRRAEPLVNLRYAKRRWSVAFGHVDQYNHFGMPLWLYDSDNFIANGPLNGEQLKIGMQHLRINQWIAWQRMIYQTSHEQERIEAGLSANVGVLDTSSRWKLDLPLQLLVHHRGGQIGLIDSGVHVVTFVNASAGVRFARRFRSSFVKLIGIAASVDYANNGDEKNGGYGLANHASLFLGFTHHLYVDVLFWRGIDYYCPSGAPLYQSRSSAYARDTAYRSARRLLMLTLSWNPRVAKNISLSAWMQPYYDLDLKLLEYAYKLRITYTFNATMRRWK